jgi:hypothetical protein
MASLATSGCGLRPAWFRQLREGTIPPGILVLVVPFLLGVAAIPLFVTRFPPLADYPGHLAITYILENYNRVAPFQAAYILDHALYPNLAMDILVPSLAGIFGIETSGRIFIFLIFAVTVCGALLVNKALYGRVSIGAFFVFCILYNGILAWGFMNYLFGLGMAMLAFGVYLLFQKHSPLSRIIVSSLLSMVVFICHLYAFAIYGTLVIFYEIFNFAELQSDRSVLKLLRNLSIAGTQAILPIVCFIYFSPMSSAHVVTQIQFGNFTRKLEALSFMFGNYNQGIDLICYVVVAVFIGFMLGRRRIMMAKPMLAALVFLCAVFVIIPAVIFSSSSADRRLIVAIALVAVSSLHLSVRSWRELLAAAATIGSVCLLQIGIAQHSWAAYDPRLQSYLAAFQSVKEGSNVAVAVDPNASWFPIDIRGVPSLLVLQRNAFPSQQFLWRGQNPVALSEKFERMVEAAPWDELYERLLAIYEARNRKELDEMVKGPLAEFHYLLVIHESPITPSLAELGLDRIAYASDFDLYRLR